MDDLPDSIRFANRTLLFFLLPEKEPIAKTGDAQHHLGILVGDLPKSVP